MRLSAAKIVERVSEYTISIAWSLEAYRTYYLTNVTSPCVICEAKCESTINQYDEFRLCHNCSRYIHQSAHPVLWTPPLWLIHEQLRKYRSTAISALAYLSLANIATLGAQYHSIRCSCCNNRAAFGSYGWYKTEDHWTMHEICMRCRNAVSDRANDIQQSSVNLVLCVREAFRHDVGDVIIRCILALMSADMADVFTLEKPRRCAHNAVKYIKYRVYDYTRSLGVRRTR